MGFHTCPPERADQLEDPSRYRYCSFEELLSAIDPAPADTVLDLGVGTGFYAIDIAPSVDRLIGVDLQPAMLELLRERERPASLSSIVGTIEHLPLGTGTVDIAYSTMTFHEYATPAAHERVRAVLGGDGRLVTVDWSSDGSGEDGPSVEERYSLAEAVSQLQATGYHISRAEERSESFLLVARTT